MGKAIELSENMSYKAFYVLVRVKDEVMRATSEVSLNARPSASVDVRLRSDVNFASAELMDSDIGYFELSASLLNARTFFQDCGW